VAEIWKEYGALSYSEFIADDLSLKGTLPFAKAVEATEDEEIIFGWVVFPSKAIRDLANQKVPPGARIEKLVAPLVKPDKLIFDARRMLYGGFKPLVDKYYMLDIEAKSKCLR
jgi:uncharacterized protein YbaA (DUF1428 family)